MKQQKYQKKYQNQRENQMENQKEKNNKRMGIATQKKTGISCKQPSRLFSKTIQNY
jgi:hypothetical protein